MKQFRLILFGLIIFSQSIVSCSKCYECTYEYQIQTSNGTTTEQGKEDFCTASQDELKAKEADGYSCS